ncbi:MAG TPA: glycine zipper 2TM domain-containing protein, partial [Usitatibacter sp.]|nr:glycine zipper 2TM domain-containing protein [Usitatibacter sp.]
LDGVAYTPTAVYQVAKAGIARTFQNIRLFGGMTALENVMVGRHVRTKHDNRYEERHDQANHKPVGTAAGAVVGGVVGHQFDNGSAGATLGGAIIGGLIGNRVAREHDEGKDQDLDYNRCRVVAEGDRVLQGYETRYEFRGREYTAMLQNQPGDRVRVDADGRVY